MSGNHSNPQWGAGPESRKEFSNVAHGLAGGLVGPLQGTARQIADFVVSNVDSPDYATRCSLTNLQTHFQTTPATLRVCLRAPTQMGLLVVRDGSVYPTPLLLCVNTPKLSNSDAAQIVRRLKTGGTPRD